MNAPSLLVALACALPLAACAVQPAKEAPAAAASAEPVIESATIVEIADATEIPGAAPPSEQHAWLQQLVGVWDVRTEATMEPGGEPMTMESTESARMFGDLWLMSEGSAEFGGVKFHSMLTIGYDANEGAFVGTWVDTMQTTLWRYRGTLDDAGKILTLEARGPAFGDPNVLTNYRDVIEVKGPGHKVMTSWMQMENGEWAKFMTAESRRR